ncbi:MAG: hypothetical protein LBJ62_09490 [Bifidobacteriaceae bacterium]|nr:hypothetical protein [Bifidobacteriaceae bacterium]
MITLLATLAALAWLMLPGMAVGLAAGMRGLSLAALSPALTLAALGGGSVLAPIVGLPWGPATAIGSAALGAAIAWLIGLVAPLRAPRLLPRWSAKAWLTVGLAALGAAGFIYVTNLAAMGGAGGLPQGWDLVFHGNLARFIEQTGDASPFHAGRLTAPTAASAFYPSAVHGIVVLLPAVTQVWPALNMVLLVASSLVWILGLVYLGRVLFPSNHWYAVAAAALGVLYQGQPTSMVGLVANSVGLALLPGLLGWSVQLARVVGVASGGRVMRSAVLLVAVVGAALAHPNVMFSYVLVASPIALYIVMDVVRRGWRAGYRVWTVVGLVGLLGITVAAVVALYSIDEVQAVMAHGGWVTSSNLLVALALGLTDATTLFQLGPNLLVAAGLVTGAVVALRRHKRRWLILSFGAVLVVYAAAVTKLKILEPLAALWYSDRTRLGPVLTVAGIPLILWGLHWAVRCWRDGRWRLPIAVVVSVGLLSALALTVARPFRLYQAYYELNPAAATTSQADDRRFFDQAELDMMWRLDQELDPAGLVLGDPANGSAYLYSLIGQPVVFAHLTGAWDQPRRYLKEHFGDLGTDPKVCQAINQLGIEYVYLDGKTFRDNESFSQMTSGLRIEGNLEMVDQGGSAAVYRITACT